jgi:hypothetical protein
VEESTKLSFINKFYLQIKKNTWRLIAPAFQNEIYVETVKRFRLVGFRYFVCRADLPAGQRWQGALLVEKPH